MRAFTTVRRPIKDWICCEDRDPEYLGKPITIDLDSVSRSSCGVRQWNVISGGIGCLVCEHVIVIGD